MEHIVQFAIGIDDEAIKQSIMERAEKQIMADLTHDVKSTIFETNRYSGQPTKTPTYYLDCRIDKILESCREDIIEMAAERLAERLCRTKKAKERLDAILTAAEEK